tara:strand:+ start:137 stop:523 length:387 start_codon:yes stop_codon:yes gene_type:complete
MPNLEISGTKGLVQVSGAGGHLKSIGTAPTLTVTTNGDGTCTVSGTDTIGELTFANTWADADTVLVTFNKAYGTAPKVMLSSAARINASGVNLIEIDTVAVTTTGFTLTASGTCVGSLTYFVVETSAT